MRRAKLSTGRGWSESAIRALAPRLKMYKDGGEPMNDDPGGRSKQT